MTYHGGLLLDSTGAMSERPWFVCHWRPRSTPGFSYVRPVALLTPDDMLTKKFKPIGSPPNAESFFQSYLAAPITLSLFVFWKVYTRDWGFGVNLREVDLDQGRRFEEELDVDFVEDAKRPGWRRVAAFLF